MELGRRGPLSWHTVTSRWGGTWNQKARMFIMGYDHIGWERRSSWSQEATETFSWRHAAAWMSPWGSRLYREARGGERG